jgi:pilus assembly protein CpaE
MSRQPEFRGQPAHGRLAPPGLVALPSPAESSSPRNLPSRDRPGDDVSPSVSTRAIPGISIQAFCDTEGTLAALEAASANRRLAKAHMEVNTGGIDTAIAACTEARAPSVLVVETTLARAPMLARLGRLADRCDPATKIIAIGHINDIPLYRELLKRGIAEYLIAPVSPAQFVEAVAGLCGAPAASHAGRLIAFIGAKGGTGSSTVCHNVAWAMSETLKCEVVVADLDLAFGTVGLDFNHETVQGVAEALQAPERLDETALDRLLTRCSQHLSILAAPIALDRDYDISAGACRTVLDALRQYAPFAALDLPHAWTPWLRQVLLAADEIVVTAAPDLANLRNAKNLVDLLEGNNGKPPRLVINMARRRKRPDLSVEEFSSALDLDPALVIEFDAETFGFAANNGQMIEEYSRKARAAQQFRTLALTLAQRAEPKEAARPSPLAPILDKLGLRAPAGR